MRKIDVKRTIPAERPAVWDVLADYPNIASWNGGVKKSYSTSEATQGVGAQRHCDLSPAGALEETVREWVPHERLAISIDSAKMLPIKSGLALFTLEDNDGATDARIVYEYVPSGWFGRLMGPILDRRLSSGFDGFLEDLEKAAVS